MGFSISAVTILTTTGVDKPLAAFRCPAGSIMRIREIGITDKANTTLEVALIRASVVSITPTGNIAGLNHAPNGPASLCTFVTGWGTAPTFGTSYLRQACCNAVIGSGVIWQFPPDDPLIVGDGSALAELVINGMAVTAAPLFRVWAHWEE